MLTSSADPRVFGPPAWYALHVMAAHYPASPKPRTQRECVRFLRALPWMLPCAICGGHLRRFLRKHCDSVDAAATSRRRLVRFLMRAHDAVRRRTLGKAFVAFDKRDAARYERATLPEDAPPVWASGSPLRR